MLALKTFRFVNHLSQQQVAEFLGVSKSYVSKAEAGKLGFHEEHLSKLILNDQGWNTEMLQELSPMFTELETRTQSRSESEDELIRLRAENSLLREQLERALNIIEKFAGQK